MKIAIVDDEQIFLRKIEDRVRSVCKKNYLSCTIKCYTSSTQIRDEEDFSSFDIVLLDIDMPGVDGITLARAINRYRCSETVPYIVFVSAMDHLVFEALEQYPYSFVRKTHLEDIDTCILNIQKSMKLSQTYGIKIGRITKLLEIDKIIYLEKMGNYVGFHTTEGVLKERSIIDDKYNDLSQFGFVRPYIGAIVNANYITEIDSNHLRLKNGKEISISRSCRKEIKEKYQEWLVRMK